MNRLLIAFIVSVAISGVSFAETKQLTLKKLVDQVPETKVTTKPRAKTQKQIQNTLLKIDIRGAESISETTIKNELSLQIGDQLNPFLINRNIKNIQSLGVFEEVVSEVQKYKAGKKLIIFIKENPKITAIQFKGNTVFDRKVLLDRIENKKGSLLNLNMVRQDIQSLQAYYQEQGYILSKVYGVKLPEKKGDPLIFNVSEGVVSEIIITGNTITQDNVIRREIEIKPGDVINQTTLKRDMRKIFNLNYFSQLLPDFVPSQAINGYKLIIKVEEKSTGSINFGGGWGQRSGAFVYSDLNVDNVLGTGQLVALRGQWGWGSGNDNQMYQFKYHNPWMWDKRRSFTYRLWDTQGNFGFSNFAGISSFRPEHRRGTDVAIGIPVNYELGTVHRVKYETVQTTDTNGDLASDYLINSYNFVIYYDTRDVRFNPLNGAYNRVSIEKGFKTHDKALNFTKYDLTFSRFIETFEKQTIATRFIYGQMDGELEEAEIYYIGGPNTVRGYPDSIDAARSGTKRAIVNLEYRWLLSDMFQTLVFVDAGWTNGMGDINSALIGKGFGIRIISPLGPIRLDFGIDEEGFMRTHFNIGHVF